MIKKLIILFKIARKLALSDALKVISKFHQPPLIIKIFLNSLSISFSKNNYQSSKLTDEEKLCTSIQEMGTTFIKLGQFLSTRPDIIGEDLSSQLEKLQDRLPPFSTYEAKEIIKKNLGSKIFDSIINFGEPVAAASIAQVHKAQINYDGVIKDVAIKILRPNIKKTFNDEIDALMLLAYFIESLISKTKRLKLVEVVFLLKEITNHEMDLRFEAAAANEFAENTKNDVGFYVPKIYWNFTSEEILTLDWIDGVSIREKEILESKKINIENLATDIIQHFLRHAVRDGFFHADMHQGNIFVSKKNPENAGYIAVDCAITGSLSNDERYTLARMLQAVLKQNYKSLSQLFISSGWVNTETNEIELENTLRACCEPIFEKPLSEIEFGKLLLYLFQSTRQYGLSIQTSLVLLQKTLIHIEGMGRQIYPELDFWGLAEPYLDNWLTEQFNPVKLKDYIIENKEDLLFKASEVPGIVYEALDELRSYSINKNSNDKKIKELELQLSKQKYINRVIGIGIIFAAAIIMIVS